MPKTRAQKTQQLEALTQAVNQPGVVFFSHQGLKVSEMEELRKAMRLEKNSVVVAKRNLLLKAVKAAGVELDPSVIPGPVAVGVGPDQVAPAKLVATFKKKHDQVSLFGGILEGKFMDKAQVEQLASLPSKQELLAKMVGSMQAPISGMVNVLAGNLRGLVNTLDAIRAQKS